MTMMLKNFLKVAAVLVAIFCINACEDDFNTVGAGLIPDSNFDALLFDATQISSKQLGIERVQTNGLPGYLLGVYSDDVYGQTTANILTQLTLSNTDPDFGDNVVLDSVILTLPYFSTQVSQSENGFNYELDSVYGDGAFKLSIIESNFFLREGDPNSDNGFSVPQRYYSNQQSMFEDNLTGNVLFDTIAFEPSNNPAILLSENEDDSSILDTLSLSPRLRVALPNDFFQENIIDMEGSEQLLNNTNFKNFLRGIYLKAEAINNDGSMLYLNPLADEANITLYYRSDRDGPLDDSGAGTSENQRQTYELNFGDITVNTYDNTTDDQTSNAFLYLKGAEANIAEVDLFQNQEQLDSIKDLNWLINEANLTFFVNQDLTDTGEKEPERIFIYDLNNNTVLLDYSIDPITNMSNPVTSRTLHLGRLMREDNGSGSFYEINITEHIRNIIQNDSTNTRLGVAVSPNVELLGNLGAEIEGEEEDIIIPIATPLTPEGTILHGVTSPNEGKRLKLNIFYTQPN